MSNSDKDLETESRSIEGLPNKGFHGAGFQQVATWNPYTDESMNETEPDPVTTEFVEAREPFNDVVKLQDMIQGHRRNRTLSDYPRQVRPWVRVGAIILLAAFVGSFIWDYLH